MLRNFDNCDVKELECDLLIIGSGAAGIALALEFNNSEFKVIVLSGGSETKEQETDALYESEVVGLKHKGVHDGRARVHGGTTTLWAGQALPFSPLDFEKRDWVPYSGWPIRYADITPYYPRAESVLKVANFDYDEKGWPTKLPAPLPFDKDMFIPRISQFSNDQNFAKSHRETLERSQNITVFINAHALNLELEPNGKRIQFVDVKSLRGNECKVFAKASVICCGAIESARLLLASDKVALRGVGNDQDLVGRFFQDHPQARIAPIESTQRKKLVKALDVHVQSRVRYSPRFNFSSSLQKKEQILDVAAGICFAPPESNPAESAKLLVRAIKDPSLRKQIPEASKQVLSQPTQVITAVAKYLILHAPVVDRSGQLYFCLQMEQAPNPQSRVSLCEQTDALGMRRCRMDWRLTELDRRTIEKAVEYFSRELERTGYGQVKREEFQMPKDLESMDQLVSDAAHHIGTTRMHSDPKQGVVDEHCRVHGVSNLFVSSSSVFPTSSSSNPTLTILALTMRLADKLKSELSRLELPKAA